MEHHDQRIVSTVGWEGGFRVVREDEEAKAKREDEADWEMVNRLHSPHEKRLPGYAARLGNRIQVKHGLLLANVFAPVTQVPFVHGGVTKRAFIKPCWRAFQLDEVCLAAHIRNKGSPSGAKAHSQTKCNFHHNQRSPCGANGADAGYDDAADVLAARLRVARANVFRGFEYYVPASLENIRPSEHNEALNILGHLAQYESWEDAEQHGLTARYDLDVYLALEADAHRGEVDRTKPHPLIIRQRNFYRELRLPPASRQHLNKRYPEDASPFIDPVLEAMMG